MIDQNGSLWICGDNWCGQLGNGVPGGKNAVNFVKVMDISFLPVAVADLLLRLNQMEVFGCGVTMNEVSLGMAPTRNPISP